MTFSFADGSTNSPVAVNAPAGNGNLYQNPQLVPFAPTISTKINALVLSANTAQAFTVPAGFTKAFISCDTPGAAVWMAYNKAAVIPTGNITNGSCPMLNPAGRMVSGGDTLSCISASNCIVICEFWE